MPKKVLENKGQVNLFVKSGDTFDIAIPFQDVNGDPTDVTFTLRKLPGGTKWAVYQDCINMDKGAIQFDFRNYFNRMLSLMIVGLNGQNFSMDMKQVDDLDEVLREVLDSYVKIPNLEVNVERSHLKKV